MVLLGWQGCYIVPTTAGEGQQQEQHGMRVVVGVAVGGPACSGRDGASRLHQRGESKGAHRPALRGCQLGRGCLVSAGSR